MQKNRKIIVFSQILIMSVLLASFGCSSNQVRITSPEEIHKRILNNMVVQKNYAFNGNLSVHLKENNIQDVVNFSGYINNKNRVYMKLNISSIENLPEEKMEVIKLPNTIKVKYNTKQKWEVISQNDLQLFHEFNNWNPEYNLKLIKDYASNIDKIKSKNGLEGLLIKIDANKMKAIIEEQMHGIKSGGLTEKDLKDMKTKLELTDVEIRSMQKDLEDQMKITKQQTDEIIRSMDINTSYKIYYRPTDYLIKEMVQITKTDYTLMGENISEATNLTIRFSDYGKVNNIPTS